MTDNNSNNESRQTVYQISSNRGHSRHKLRYVEASAPAADDCRLCVGSIADYPEAKSANADEYPPREDQ